MPVAADVPAARKAGMPSPDVEALLAQMTLDEKIGQMTQADMKALKDGTEVRDFHARLGSVGRRFVAEAERAGHLGRDVRPLPEPGAVDPARDPDALRHRRRPRPRRRQGRGDLPAQHRPGLHARSRAGRGGRARHRARGGRHGHRLDFAPCIAVARDERWGRTYESYGETPELAESLGAAAIRGFEHGDRRDRAILASAKHFLADGGTLGGKDQGDAQISEEELRRIHLPGYVAAIKAGVGSVMVSYSSWNGQHMHGNKRLITDVLKGELGFGGFVVTDWEAIDRMAPGDYSQAIDIAINAGIDMVMVPNAYRDFIPRLKALVPPGACRRRASTTPSAAS